MTPPQGADIYLRDMHRAGRWGLAMAALLVLGTGVWAATSEISGAVIAPGRVVVHSELKKVQHPTGGVVSRIMVRDGQDVRAGQPLLVLDDTLARANLAVIERALDENMARQARLRSERDGLSEIGFPAALAARASDLEVAAILDGERRLFALRKVEREGNKSRLRERQAQSREEIAGLEEQVESKTGQLTYIRDELAAARDLWEKKLTPLSRLNALEREAVKLRGDRGGLTSGIAQTRGQIAELDLQILQVDRQFISEVANELRETDAKIGELTERKIAARDQLARIIITAPATGLVHGLAVFTVGGVVGPGEVLMMIVPNRDDLEVEARIRPVDVDQVRPGARTRLRLSAFNQRTTPELEASLQTLSADVETDPRTGEIFYTARLTIPQTKLGRLKGLHLLPGMPVETYIETSTRNVLSLALKPLTDQMHRAFRDN